MENLTVSELESQLGDDLKRLRLQRNIEQGVLARQAGLSVRALQRLENGEGSSLSTLLKVLRALGRESWLKGIAPVATINPVTAVRHSKARQRASAARSK
ncbi:MAG: helix-turn-helix domain-containing protein [Pseudazoarcus pumilus]|mgnify:CR=1 FL=1|nr:helix-turn-helix domain-containing protein [Pseudazoarcus pumilus]